MKVKLGDLIEEYSERNVGNKYKPVAVGKYGIRTRESIYSKELAKDYSKNKLIHKGTLTVGMGSNQIDIGILRDDETYSVSPAYHTYKIKISNYDYLDYLLAANNNRMFSIYANRGSRQGKTLDLKRWLTDELYLHDEKDQKIIVQTLNTIKRLVSQKEAELVKLDNLIKARFVEMFGVPIDNTRDWPMNKAENLCALVTDGSHFSPKACDKGYPMLSVKDMGQNGFDYSNCKYVDDDTFEILKKQGCVPNVDDVLIAKDGSYFTRAFVISEYKDQAILSSIGIYRPNKKLILPRFLASYLMTDEVREFVNRGYVTGTALRRVIIKGLKAIPVYTPPIDLQEEFVQFVQQVDKSKFAVQKSLEKTHLLFDSLMQEYFG